MLLFTMRTYRSSRCWARLQPTSKFVSPLQMPNQYGLNRDIPDDIKRAVRQRCGFGCILCAGSVFEYEHFDPEFARARQHNTAGITLLCPTCHAKKTRNLLSAWRVREANENPAAIGRRYAYSELEGTLLRPFIKLAGMTLRNCEMPLQVRGFPVLQVEDAEFVGGPYRLSATFFNASGKPSLFIRRNEWQVLADSWDVELVGSSITVRTGPREIALRLNFQAGVGLVVERLVMLCDGYRIVGNADTLDVYSPQGGRHRFTQCISDGMRIGLSLG